MIHKHKYTTRSVTGNIKRKKNYSEKNNDSDSDLESNSASDSDSEYNTESDMDSDFKLESNNKLKKKPKNINKLNYYKFLNKLFPSNYSRDRINKLKRQRLLGLDEINNDNNINFIVNDNSNSFNKIINNTDNNSNNGDNHEIDYTYNDEDDNDKTNKNKLLKFYLNY